MNFNVTSKDGVKTITDADTGKPVDWIDTFDFVLGPDGTPMLYLGTTHFNALIGVGPTPAPPVPPRPPA